MSDRFTTRKDKPRTELTPKEAFATITALEKMSIKQKLGFRFQDNPEIADSVLVWVLENRDKGPGEAVSWKTVGAMSMQEIEDYFSDDEIDIDPEGEQANLKEEA